MYSKNIKGYETPIINTHLNKHFKEDFNMNMPRPEHPNPQWERTNWRNLNGTWEFEFDFGCTAAERNACTMKSPRKRKSG